MILRKIKNVDSALLAKLEAKPKPRSHSTRVFFLILLALLLATAFLKPRSLRIDTTLIYNGAYDYIKKCITNILHRPAWNILLLFGPALVFDTVRYYLTNTIVFFVSIFRKRNRAFDKYFKYPLVSIILPAYNESAGIRETLNSILESDYPNFEIIVVDDCSTDATALICKDYERNGLIKYFRKAQRGGKPSALNYGLKFARGEYVVHFDAEVLVYRDTISQAIKPFKDPKIGVVSGNLKVFNDRASLATRLQAAEYAICISVQRRWLAFTDTLQIASGAFGVFRRNALLSLMGVDPETGEDLDITLKFRKLGYKVAFAPLAVAKTNVPSTFKKLFRQRIRWDECYIRLNLRKHGNIANLRHFRIGDFVAFCLDIVFNLLLLLVFPIYILWIAAFERQFFIFIIVATYLFYFLMDLWQLIIAISLSDRPRRDAVFILYAPLFFFYSFFLRITRIIAYSLELLRLKYLKDGYFPPIVWENMPKY